MNKEESIKLFWRFGIIPPDKLASIVMMVEERLENE